MNILRFLQNFKTENLGLFLLGIRSFIASGLTVKQMAKEITENYTVAKHNDQASMEVILRSVYEFEESDSEYDTGCITRKYAEMLRD